MTIGRKSYRKENLAQCIKNLFSQARYELKTIHNIENSFSRAIAENSPLKVKVFSMWDNEEDCFYATSFSIWRIEDSKIIIDLSVYVKYSDYMSSIIVGTSDTPNGIFEWLRMEDSVNICTLKANKLISNIE